MYNKDGLHLRALYSFPHQVYSRSLNFSLYSVPSDVLFIRSRAVAATVYRRTERLSPNSISKPRICDLQQRYFCCFNSRYDIILLGPILHFCISDYVFYAFTVFWRYHITYSMLLIRWGGTLQVKTFYPNQTELLGGTKPLLSFFSLLIFPYTASDHYWLLLYSNGIEIFIQNISFSPFSFYNEALLHWIPRERKTQRYNIMIYCTLNDL
jgi:hypothetical protein